MYTDHLLSLISMPLDDKKDKAFFSCHNMVENVFIPPKSRIWQSVSLLLNMFLGKTTTTKSVLLQHRELENQMGKNAWFRLYKWVLFCYVITIGKRWGVWTIYLQNKNNQQAVPPQPPPSWWPPLSQHQQQQCKEPVKHATILKQKKKRKKNPAEGKKSLISVFRNSTELIWHWNRTH